MSDLAAVLLVGIGTYASRSVFIVSLANRAIPPSVLQALKYVAPAVLSALIVALLIDADGSVALGPPEAVALAAGGAVAYKTRNHILTLMVGMTVFWAVRSLR